MLLKQKQQLTFLHHALWSLAKDLPQENAVLIAQISEFRNQIEKYAERNQNLYCKYVIKGGIELVNDITL